MAILEFPNSNSVTEVTDIEEAVKVWSEGSDLAHSRAEGSAEGSLPVFGVVCLPYFFLWNGM